ncbi:hypothetical protein K523DRAFT_241533 [Schizophyllum commune Tattone D]|nr:hypothetical protein K523DRAFT_241533 [Schizophyllum commune Tattone D]
MLSSIRTATSSAELPMLRRLPRAARLGSLKASRAATTPVVHHIPSRATSTSTNASGAPPNRGLHTTSEVRNIVADRGRAVAQETEDIFLMDRLLEVVSQKVDRAHVRDIPMRNPALWSESGLFEHEGREHAPKEPEDGPIKTLYEPHSKYCSNVPLLLNIAFPQCNSVWHRSCSGAFLAPVSGTFAFPTRY